MATLRPVEERDSKGNVIRVNPSITFVQDREIRKPRGRNDFDLKDNPDYHQPITAQVQGNTIYFFYGTPHTTQARAVAKEVSQAEVKRVAPYIIANIDRNPIRVREAKPMVYEVKLASMCGEEQPAVVEHVLQPGTTELTVEPTVPERWTGERTEHGGAPQTA
jgi:hypothetical protein